MGLKAMSLGGGLAVIAHGDGQEVVLDVRIVHALVGPDEGAAFKLVRRPKPGAGEQPLRADDRLAPEVPVFVKRYRQLRCKLHVDFQMVLQVRPDARPVRHHLDTVRFSDAPASPIPDSIRSLRRVDRRGRKDHLGPLARITSILPPRSTSTRSRHGHSR
jgi:hypothetical protein